MSISVYTDGGCIGNPGPGAWAFVIVLPSGVLIERSAYHPDTTNNRMELQAAIEALRHISTEPEELSHQHYRLHTDSAYLKNGISQWIISWKRGGWKTSAKKAVKNRDLWVELDRLNERVKPEWVWVKGHAGVEFNERCDQLVKISMKLKK